MSQVVMTNGLTGFNEEKKLPINALLPWSHWVTPKQERYRYDTYFYLSPLYLQDPTSLLAAHDNSETTSVSWLRPEEALQLFRKGQSGTRTDDSRQTVSTITNRRDQLATTDLDYVE